MPDPKKREILRIFRRRALSSGAEFTAAESVFAEHARFM
jgi:hypothetical protein